MTFDWTSFFIITSVLTCGIAGYGSIILILRRVINTDSIFFSLFLFGMTSYVVLYSFLKLEETKYLHYPLQTIAVAICTFGFFMFSYSLKNEGANLKEMAALVGGVMTIPPILCIIFTPFTFIIEPYGYELQIEPWFLTLFAIITLLFIFYASYYLLFLGLKSPSIELRKKIKIILISICIEVTAGLIFLTIIPIFFQAHDIKPIGYYIISVFTLLMVYAFKKEGD